MSSLAYAWDALTGPWAPYWLAAGLVGAVLIAAFVVVPLATYPLAAWHRRQARKRREIARRQAPECEHCEPRSGEWSRWRSIAGSYISGETTDEPSREGRQ